MITHIFNSSVVSGPETLAIPALKNLGEKTSIIFLTETRREEACKGPVEYARDLGHDVYTIPVRGRWDREAFKSLRKLLDSIEPRVAHSHDVKASLYLLKAAKVRKGFKAKLVSTHHGAIARYGKIRVYEEFYVRFILPHFDAVLVMSEGDRQSLKRRGVAERLLHVHINGVNRQFIDRASRDDVQREIRDRWRQIVPSLPTDAVYVGAVARLSTEKRHDRMLNAFRTIKTERPDLKFAFVNFGIGAEESKLKEITANLGLTDSVFWMGYSKSIGQEMAGFDLLLCLSDGEGIPINLLEAGWSGTPVFSTAVGGIPDVINGPEVGYLVQKEDSDEAIGRSLARVISDRDGRAVVGQAYQARIIENFSEKAWLDFLRSLYASFPVRT